jgi:hypothetical protein
MNHGRSVQDGLRGVVVSVPLGRRQSKGVERFATNEIIAACLQLDKRVGGEVQLGAVFDGSSYCGEATLVYWR